MPSKDKAEACFWDAPQAAHRSSCTLRSEANYPSMSSRLNLQAKQMTFKTLQPYAFPLNPGGSCNDPALALSIDRRQ
jgi:hypothetical protein